jgi:hypothetical protein
MKKLIVAAAFAAFALSPASARAVSCTGESFARMTDHISTMPYGPRKLAMMHHMAIVNTDLSTGDTPGACTHYGMALAIQNNVRDPFADLHEE